MGVLYHNAANLVVLLRVALALVAVALLGAEASATRLVGLALLAVAALLDGLDGYLARRLAIASSVGAQLDTLGDRITENVLFVFLACAGLIPLAVPILFLTRSFLADFVRSLHERHGVRGTFAMHTSRVGQFVVASRTSRALYLGLKFAVFLGGGAVLAFSPAGDAPSREAFNYLACGVYWGAVLATGVNLVRFAALLHDSTTVLREEFGA